MVVGLAGTEMAPKTPFLKQKSPDFHEKIGKQLPVFGKGKKMLMIYTYSGLGNLMVVLIYCTK